MKINIFPLSSSLHDEGYINQEINQLINNLQKQLLSYFKMVEIKLTTIDQLYDCDFPIILIQSGGSEQWFLKAYKEFKEPVYLLAYDTNNSLAASLEILSFLNSEKKKAEVLHGDISYLANRIISLSVIKEEKNITNLGVIGKPSDWLIASNVNYQTALKLHLINLIDIPIEELIEEYNKVTKYSKPSLMSSFDKIEISKALRLNQAMNNLVRRYNLQGVTIRCFDLINSTKTTGCLSLSLLNDNNIIGTCEGDIPSMISMYLIKKLTGLASFQANPAKIDISKKEIIFAHCTIPFSMVNEYQFMTHYESNSGIGIRGNLLKQKVTIFKLGSNLSDYYVTSGEIIENLQENNLCRTQIRVKIDNNIEYFLKKPLGNHHIIVYGDYVDLLNKYMKEI